MIRILLAMLVLASCGGRTVAAVGADVAEQAVEQASVPAESPDLVAARKALAEAQALVAGLEEQAAAERMESQRRLLAWSSGIAILGALACVALGIFLAPMRKTLLMGASACFGVLVTAQAIGQALPWLPAIGAAMAVAALAIGLIVAIRAVRHSAALADRLKEALGIDAAQPLLDDAREAQKRAGVRHVIQRVRNVPRRTGAQ